MFNRIVSVEKGMLQRAFAVAHKHSENPNFPEYTRRKFREIATLIWDAHGEEGPPPAGAGASLLGLIDGASVRDQSLPLASPVEISEQVAAVLIKQDLTCTLDVLNPCWDNRPGDQVGLHWGSEPGRPVPACAACVVRALVARATEPHKVMAEG